MSLRAALVLLLLTSCLQLQAQTYSTSTSTGSKQYIFEFRQSGSVTVYPPPKDEVMSEVQALPFAWNFYGKPVTHYRISDNGYITFDSAAAASVPGNTVLPSATAPKNAIFAFWDDLHSSPTSNQWSNEVRTCTWGTAPNRVHVIYWISFVPKGVESSTSNMLSFALALYEGGDFEIVFVAGRATVRTTGTIGAANEDGSLGVMLDGSPDISCPLLTADPGDDICHAFTWSSSATDLALAQLFLPKTAKLGSALDVKGSVKNSGAQPVTAFDLTWQANGGPAMTRRFEGLNIVSNQTYAFTHPDAWTPNGAAGTPGGAGAFSDFRVWISNVNANEDANPKNDTLPGRVFVNLGATVTHRPLVEEFTGAWCGWCPDGGLQMQALEAAVPQAVLVSIHAGGLDSMTIPEGEDIASAYRPGYPQAMVDRTQFPGQAAVPMNRTGGAWQNRAQQQLTADAPLQLAFENVAYDDATRSFSADVKTSHVDYFYPGDLRLNVFVVEDRVIGSGRGYDQNNYYSGNTSYPTHPYYSETNPILGFVHRHVLRATLTGVWGVPLSNAGPGAAETKSYTWTLLPGMKPADVKLVAFASYYAGALPERIVLNACDAPLVATNGVERSLPASLEVGSLYPNPAADAAFLPIALPTATPLRVQLFDLLGRCVFTAYDARMEAGSTLLPLSLTGLRAGTYMAVVSAGAMRVARVLHVTR